MTPLLQQIYRGLPPGLRSAAASLRGSYLRSWRYNATTDRLVNEALEREYWSEQRWAAWQQDRLARVLHRAATHVPYYAAHWRRRRQRGDNASPERLENWPVLEKEAVRQDSRAFVADDCDVRRMFPEHTSGTSGTPLNVWWSRRTVIEWYALFEARWRRWYGVSRHQRWAILGGQLIVPVARRRPPFWIWNMAMKQLYMSSYHLSEASVPEYLRALERYEVTYIFGYTSSLVTLAQGALKQGWEPSGIKVVITNAEPVSAVQKAIMADAFRCPVRETYGMSEIVTAAGECNCNRLHLWPEVGVVEIVSGYQTVARGAIGDLVCTGLLNTDMPLIRYRVGDQGYSGDPEIACGCGRGLPVLGGLSGRRDDLLYTVDGRHVGRLDPVFKADLPVREAQIVQESRTRIRVVYVAAEGFGPNDASSIIERLRERLGPVTVVLESVAAIPRGPNGKFKSVVSHLRSERHNDVDPGCA